MKNCLIFKLLYSYFIIQLSLIKSSNIFKQIKENDEIIYIYPLSSKIIIYMTFKSSNLIRGDSKTKIEDNFNFSSSTRIISNNSYSNYIASCTKDNFVESFTLYGKKINSISYNDLITKKNIKSICPIHLKNSSSIIEIGYSTYIEKTNLITIGYNEYKVTSNSLPQLSSYSKNIQIGDYVTLENKMYFQQIFINNKRIMIYKQENIGLNLNDGNNFQIEDTKSEFKIAFIYENDAIVYYFEKKLKLFYMNITGYYRYEIDTISSFDFDNLELSEMINNGKEKKFLCVYKSKSNNNLFIELYKLNGDKFQMQNFYEISNYIGISKIYLKKVKNIHNFLDLYHFLLIK